MEIIKNPKSMQRLSLELKKAGKRVGFVPTMGALHEGHLSLVTMAKEHADTVVMSIYLNPTQFEPTEDLSNYPSNLERDLKLAEERGVDIVFCPSDKTMYPEGFQTYIETTEISKGLCGASRPSHFRGVTTIVLKLFNTVVPDVAVFGKKDYQQLAVIKQMVKDLDLNIEIIGAPIVRESDGIAMSSRNAYLTEKERLAAHSINQSLSWARETVKNGEKDLNKIIENIKSCIEENRIGRVDYVKICDPETLEELKEFKSGALLAIAARFGKARLIDNCIL